MKASEQITPAKLRSRRRLSNGKRLTQSRVASIFNVRRATVSDWERLEKYPSLTFSRVVKLTRLYQCTVEELAEAFDGPEALAEAISEAEQVTAENDHSS